MTFLKLLASNAFCSRKPSLKSIEFACLLEMRDITVQIAGKIVKRAPLLFSILRFIVLPIATLKDRGCVHLHFAQKNIQMSIYAVKMQDKLRSKWDFQFCEL